MVPTHAWTLVIDADANPRGGTDVTEITGMLTLTAWPNGMRVIVRRERPHPGAQLNAFEERDGWRYQAFITNTPAGQLAFLDAGVRVGRASRNASAAARPAVSASFRPSSRTSTPPGSNSP
jgi:hypothetical protein